MSTEIVSIILNQRPAREWLERQIDQCERAVRVVDEIYDSGVTFHRVEDKGEKE